MSDERTPLDRAKYAMKFVTPGKPVQFSPQYCEEAKDAPFKEWDTSHDLSVIQEDGSRYRIGHFRHADDALFDQIAREVLPDLIEQAEQLQKALETLRRIQSHEPSYDYAKINEYGVSNQPGSPYDRGRQYEAELLSKIAKETLIEIEGEENEQQ